MHSKGTKSRPDAKNPFKEIQDYLDGVFDVYEHVKGKEARDISEEELYGMLVSLIELVGNAAILNRYDVNGEVVH